MQIAARLSDHVLCIVTTGGCFQSFLKQGQQDGQKPSVQDGTRVVAILHAAAVRTPSAAHQMGRHLSSYAQNGAYCF